MKEIKHYYKEYEQTKLWELIDKGIVDLVMNQDIVLTTKKEYVVGYLCKNIIQNLKKINEEESR